MSDKSLIQTLNALLVPDQRKTLKALEPRGSLGGKRVVSAYRATATGGSGVAWPLKERTKPQDGKQVPDRDFWPDLIVTTSDGIFTFEVPPFRTLKLDDADQGGGEVQLAEPVGS